MLKIVEGSQYWYHKKPENLYLNKEKKGSGKEQSKSEMSISEITQKEYCDTPKFSHTILMALCWLKGSCSL